MGTLLLQRYISVVPSLWALRVPGNMTLPGNTASWNHSSWSVAVWPELSAQFSDCYACTSRISSSAIGNLANASWHFKKTTVECTEHINCDLNAFWAGTGSRSVSSRECSPSPAHFVWPRKEKDRYTNKNFKLIFVKFSKILCSYKLRNCVRCQRYRRLNFKSTDHRGMAKIMFQYSDTSANEWPCYRFFRLTKIFFAVFWTRLTNDLVHARANIKRQTWTVGPFQERS